MRVSPQSDAAIGWFSTSAPADSSAIRMLRAQRALLRLEVILSNLATNFYINGWSVGFSGVIIGFHGEWIRRLGVLWDTTMAA